VIVEAAIVVPLLILLAFGAIEYGFAFRESASVKSASRAGVRMASALPRNPEYLDKTSNAVTSAMRELDASTPEELWIYKASASGGRPETCTANCAQYRWDPTAQSGEGAFVLDSGTPWPYTQQIACASADNPNYPEQIGVFVKVRHNRLTGLFGSSSALTSASVMRLEPYAGTGGCGL
jgi:Flp pilus assembly protein TadG